MAAERGVIVEVKPEVIAWLAKNGFDPAMGARPLARAIHEEIKTPLSRLMVVGDLRNGGSATIKVKDDKIVVTGKAAK